MCSTDDKIKYLLPFLNYRKINFETRKGENYGKKVE